LASAIFSTAVVSQEVEQKTIVYLLTRPVPRWKLLIMRTLASMLVVFAVSSIMAIGIALATLGPSGLTAGSLWRDIMSLGIGSMAYGSLFVLVSLFWNRAMIICLLFAFGWETSIPNMPGSMYYLSVASYLTNISEHSSAAGKGFMSVLAGQASPETVSTPVAWAVLVAITVGCAVLGAQWFSTHEYLPREDAA
jgi:ABC-2 type transport system permease protein